MSRDFVREVERFLTAKNMKPTVLGREALGDPNFVRDLKEGRRVWPETAEKVRAYMDAHTTDTASNDTPHQARASQ